MRPTPARPDFNWHLAGPGSKATLETPIEFLLVNGEGFSASEFVLVRLKTKPNSPEFRHIRSGLGGAKSRVDRDAIAFDFNKVKPGGGGGPRSPPGALGKAHASRVLE